MNEFYLVRKNLTRNKLRLVLNIFAIMIAFFLFGALGSIKSAFDAGVELSADDRLVVVNKISFTQTMPLAYVNKIKTIEGVQKVTWANWFGGYYQDPKKQAMTFAVDPESYLDVYPELTLPDEQRDAWFNNRQGVIVGQAMARNHGWKVSDKVPLSSNIFSHKEGGQTWEVVIEGIFSGKDAQTDTNFILMHHNYFFETQSYGGEWIGWISLSTGNPDLNQQVATAIDEQFANSTAETETSTEAAFNKAFIEQIGDIGLILTSVILAAFFTILLIVGNTMMLSIRERTREIAVLKTLGFPAANVFRMVLSESLLLGIVGGVVGHGAGRDYGHGDEICTSNCLHIPESYY
jgi:putative ABC transport system permease protein